MLGRRRSRDADIDLDEVLRASTEILQNEGPIAITAERLARAHDVPIDRLRAAVDVSAMIAEAFRTLSVQELAEVRRTVLANPSPNEQMRALLNWLATPPEDSDGIRLEAWALARHNPGLRQAVQEGEAAWHGLVASVVRRGARSGDFRQIDAEEIAAHIISLVDGVNNYQLIGYRSDLDRLRLLTRVVQAELGLAWGPALATALA